MVWPTKRLPVGLIPHRPAGTDRDDMVDFLGRLPTDNAVRVALEVIGPGLLPATIVAALT
jgi:hypothetical protein